MTQEEGRLETREVGQDQHHGYFHINRKTLPLKLTLFLFYGSMSAILPYLTIQMKDIGISLTEIAIIYAILPFTSFLGPPILGIMADQMGQYKSVLIVSTLITGVFNTALLAVPKYSETIIYSETVLVISESGTTIRPANSTTELCQAFNQSLQSASTSPVWNYIIINVNCENNGNLTERSILNWSQKNLSIYCTPQSNDNDTLPNIPNCRQQNYYGNLNKQDETGDRISEGRLLAPSCALKVQVDMPHMRDMEETTCWTNYTFDSGQKETTGKNSVTFWLYFLLRIIGNVFMSACFSLLDATTLAVVKSVKGSEYGKERILCTLGFAVVSPLAGLLVDRVSAMKGYTDYSAAFYLSNALLLLNIVGYFFMSLQVEKPEGEFYKNATKLLNYPEVIVFLGMIFVLGNMWGFVESYLFIFLDELKAPKYLLGLTLTVGSLAGIPFLYGAEALVAKAGRVNIIVLAFLFYFARFFGYSYIPTPFWCFPFEAMEAFTYHLMWVAAATYCAVLAPKGLLATLTGVMGSLHYGLGKGSGAFIGGYVISATKNTRLSFRYFGIVAGAVGLIYFVINTFWLEAAIKRRNAMENNDGDMNEKQKGEPVGQQKQREPMLPAAKT